VAVTLQVTLKVAVEGAGNGFNTNPLVCRAFKVGVAGVKVIDPTGVEVNVTDVQFSPVLGGSRKVAPPAAAGPRLETVTV
jgi:hypothetical protein